MTNKSINKRKFPSMSLVEYWYLSLKKDIKAKKFNYFISNKNLRKKKSLNKLTNKRLNSLKRSLVIFQRRNLIYSITKKSFYRSFKIWIQKKYKKVFSKKLNYNIYKRFFYKKLKKFKKKVFYKKVTNYKLFFNLFTKKVKNIKFYNRLFYLNNLFIFSKFLTLNRISLRNFKMIDILNFLNLKKFKNFGSIKFKRKSLIKWWYFFRFKTFRIKKFRIQPSFIKVNDQKFFLNTKIYLVSHKNFKKFFNSFLFSLSRISKSFLINLKLQLQNLKNKNKVIYSYLFFILKFYIKFLYKNSYLFYSFILYLLSISFTNLINIFNLNLNLLSIKSLNKNNLFSKSKFNLDYFVEKSLSFFNLRISKNKLFKIIYFWNNFKVNIKNNFKFINKFKSFFVNFKINFNQIKYNKLYNFKSQLLTRKDLLYQQNIFVNNINNIFFEKNTFIFEKLIKKYYLYFFNFFFEFKLKFNHVYFDLNIFINDISLFCSSFRFNKIDRLFFKYLLKDQSLLQILMLSFNNFNILFYLILKLLIKNYILNLKKFTSIKSSLLSFKIKKIFNKITWKSNININDIIKKNIFDMNKFYINYISLYKFIQVEKIKLVEGFYKIKNIFNVYKKVNPAKTLIISDTIDRKLFCLIWNIWESYFFYRDILINFSNNILLLKTKTKLLNNLVVFSNLKTTFNFPSIFFKKKFDKKNKRRELSFNEKNFRYKSKRLLSRYFVRKKFSYFNMIFFWYLFYFNKIFFWIKIILFRIWLENYFVVYKFQKNFFEIYKLDLSNFIYNKNWQLKIFHFNLVLKNYFIDYYRSINIFNTYFFKSNFESALIHLSFVSISTSRKIENKKFDNCHLNFFKS